MKKKTKFFSTAVLLSIVMLLSWGVYPAYAEPNQDTKIAVSGVVSDADGPIIGASVVEKGNAGNASITNVNGQYLIRVSANATLEISYLGYKTQSVSVNGKTAINVSLETSLNELEEVVITAEFGLKRVARSMGSSAQNVKATDITNSGRDNFITALQGRVSGMNVVSSGGTPGASTTVTLRSMTSMSGNNQPLYVVDGIPMNNSSFNPSSGFAVADVYASRNLDFSSRGNYFNPEDIESMTVLKGAAAAALYGSDASNGAIIITTKKGNPGKGTVSYSYSSRWDNAYGYPEQQTKYANGAYGATSYYNLNRYGGLFPDDTKFYDNVAAVLQTGLSRNHKVSVEGGNDRTTIRASVAFLDQTGIIKTTDLGRSNLSLSGKSKITDWLSFEAAMQYTNTTNTKTQKGTSGPVYYAMRWPIIDDMSNYLDPDGIHMRYPDRYIDGDLVNVLYKLHKNKYYDESDRVIANTVAIITPSKNTFFRAQVGWDVGAQTFETAEHPYWATYNYDILPGNGGTINISKSNFSDPTITILGGWNNKYLNDKLSFSAQAGYHQLENGVTRLSAYGKDFAVLDLQSINNTDPATQTAAKRVTKRRIQAISGRVEVGWNNLAFLTASARNDWSSTLPINNNSYFYPALEGSFIVTDLPSLKNNTAVSYLKLRGAVSQVGKDVGPLQINPELLRQEYTGNGYLYGNGGPNPSLRPEITTQKEIGAEGRFWNDRIVADFTYFKTRSDDQIISDFRMSYAAGFPLYTQNMGTLETWGWEGLINVDVLKTHDFLWNVSFNAAHTGSKVVDMPVDQFYDAYTWNSGNIRTGAMIGEPLSIVLGNDYQRNDAGQVLIDPTTGIPLPDASTTLKVLGDREPKLRFGITTTATYKGFRLSAMLAGKYKGDVVNGTKRYMMQNGSSWESVAKREQGPVVFNGIVKDGNENTANPTVNTISMTYGDYNSSIYSGLDPNWIEHNVHYIRLQELRLSYTIPQRYLKQFFNGFVNYVSVYVIGNDLFVWTNYSGIDAVGNTVSASAGGVGGEGYDTWGIPSPRGITTGLSLTF
jgi:TonB-linked SusC/RagA family outer membrane protein